MISTFFLYSLKYGKEAKRKLWIYILKIVRQKSIIYMMEYKQKW